MSFGSSTVLTYKKRSNEYSNSTKSCVIDCDSKIAYSYEEKIAIVIYSKKHKEYITLYNDYNFSKTTSTHQNTIKGHEQLKSNKSFYIYIPSMNNFSYSQAIENLNSAIYTDNLKEFIFYYFGENSKTKKFIKELKEKTEKAENDTKEFNKKQKRLRDLENKLSLLDYKDEKSLFNALEKYKKDRTYQITLSGYIKDDNLRRFIEFIFSPKFKEYFYELYFLNGEDCTYTQNIFKERILAAKSTLILNNLGD